MTDRESTIYVLRKGGEERYEMYAVLDKNARADSWTSSMSSATKISSLKELSLALRKNAITDMYAVAVTQQPEWVEA